jgi:ubiquinone/menaquinone biosynthesis C-methylase UbiE
MDFGGAASYEQRMFGTAGGKIVNWKELKPIIDWIKKSRRGPLLILDIGTGTGRVARSLIATCNCTVVSIDRNREMIKYAKSKRIHESYFHRMDIVLADAENLPFRPEVFDIVVCIRVLKWIQNYDSCIESMAHVLKNQGHLIIELSNIYSLSVLVKLMAHLKKNITPPILFRWEVIKGLLVRKGFGILDVRALHKIHPLIWYNIKSAIGLRLLTLLESALDKVTPTTLLSRGILIRLKKMA